MMKSNTKLILLFLLLAISGNAFSNNLKISNISRSGNSEITFDVSWENGWRESTDPSSMHDAVWIFIKIRANDSRSKTLGFTHLNIAPTGHQFSSGITGNQVDGAP